MIYLATNNHTAMPKMLSGSTNRVPYMGNQETQFPGNYTRPYIIPHDVYNNNDHPLYMDSQPVINMSNIPQHDALPPSIPGEIYKSHDAPPFEGTFYPPMNIQGSDQCVSVPHLPPPSTEPTYTSYGKGGGHNRLRSPRGGNTNRPKTNSKGPHKTNSSKYDSNYLEQYTNWLNEGK